MVTVGKIFARQGKIHLCFRLQLKITDLMFNLNINKNTAPCRYFCQRRAVVLYFGLLISHIASSTISAVIS